MSHYVLDNAITMAWCFTDEATQYTEDLLDRLSALTDTAVVPSLWLYEVTNVSMLTVRKRRITKAKATKFLDDLIDLPIEIEPQASRAATFASISKLMDEHRLTAYDAAYLELVIRRHLPLATFDQKLIDSCKAVGGSLV